jgi:release factor glutamine methyltransferase
VLTRTESWLRKRGIQAPRLDTELLLCHVLGLERLQLYLAHDRPMNRAELDALRPLVRRRGAREPLAWVIGTQGFHAIDLAVGPGVLVPRPDTETLVNAALEWIGQSDEPVYLADIGCGSGAIGLALAHALPHARIYCVDIADEPLAITKQNVAALGLADRVAVLKGDLLAPIPAARPIDYVVSNPPYIPSKDIDGLQPEVARHEPRRALDGGSDGLDVYRRLIPIGAERARKGILLEVGHDQAPRVMDLFRRHGLSDLSTWKDLGGITRVVGARVG